jgi:hypothetical protein
MTNHENTKYTKRTKCAKPNVGFFVFFVPIVWFRDFVVSSR